MGKEGIGAMDDEDGDDHIRVETNQWNETPEYIPGDGLKNGDARRNAEIEFFTLVVNNMCSP